MGSIHNVRMLLMNEYMYKSNKSKIFADIKGNKNISNSTKLVAQSLLYYFCSNSINGRCNPSIAMISKISTVSISSVNRALAQLVSNGYITKTAVYDKRVLVRNGKVIPKRLPSILIWTMRLVVNVNMILNNHSKIKKTSDSGHLPPELASALARLGHSIADKNAHQRVIGAG